MEWLRRVTEDFKALQLTLLLVSWIALFTLGVHISTAGAIEQLENASSWGSWCSAFFTVLPCWTLSNLGFLCLISAWIGSQGGSSPQGASKTLTKGFLIYSVVLAVLVISQRGEVSTPLQDRYIWLAGVSSAICFASTYQPALFERLINSIAEFGTKLLNPFTRETS